MESSNHIVRRTLFTSAQTSGPLPRWNFWMVRWICNPTEKLITCLQSDYFFSTDKINRPDSYQTPINFPLSLPPCMFDSLSTFFPCKYNLTWKLSVLSCRLQAIMAGDDVVCRKQKLSWCRLLFHAARVVAILLSTIVVVCTSSDLGQQACADQCLLFKEVLIFADTSPRWHWSAQSLTTYCSISGSRVGQHRG